MALVGDDPSVQIVSNAQLWYITQMMQGTEYEGCRFCLRRRRSRPARAVCINGAQLRGWLERSAGMFNQITPGKADQVLLNDSFSSYNFDVMDGVNYEIDLSQPSRSTAKGEMLNEGAKRIVNLTYQGQPVSDDMEFIVATNNYRAGGGGKFPGTGDTVVFEGPDTNRDVIVRYIVEQGTINPSADGNWRFKPLAQTSVLLDTGPKGVAYLDDVKGVAIEPAGDGPDGFARFRITL